MTNDLPLFACLLAGPEARQRVLSIIAAHFSDQPASIAYLQSCTGLNERAIKQVVEQARIGGAPICARRTKPNGYYWASSAADLEQSAALMVSQARRMLQAAGKLIAKHRIRELLGQDVLEDKGEAA